MNTLIAANLMNEQVQTQQELQWSIACSTTMKIVVNNWIFVRESEPIPMQEDLHSRINEIDEMDVESELIHGNKDCQMKIKPAIN